MQLGLIAVLISIVVALYISVLMYLITRAMYRALRDKPAHPTHLHIVIDDLDKCLDKKLS